MTEANNKNIVSWRLEFHPRRLFEEERFGDSYELKFGGFPKKDEIPSALVSGNWIGKVLVYQEGKVLFIERPQVSCDSPHTFHFENREIVDGVKKAWIKDRVTEFIPAYVKAKQKEAEDINTYPPEIIEY